MERNIKLSNLFSNDRIFDEANALLRQLIPIINKDLFLESRISHSLDLLPSNSNSKMVYDCIYLLLPFNQLQRLTIKTILDHTIKNKRNMFFYINEQ